MSQSARIEQVSGRAVVVRGNDIDTDRIIPARFLKTITFDGLEHHLFEDDRSQTAGRGDGHPIDNPRYRGASIMIVGANFGCGSSREHAPQAIRRWGVRAILGESYAEIFFGNSTMIGLPCVLASHDDIERLMAAVESDPTVTVTIDLATMRASAGSLSVPITMPDGARAALRSGDWDATALLIDHYEQVEAAAARLPYLSGFPAVRA
jgi:3-isopropylmalate/(R)-2-methylmalate dehydratase small subunit